MIDESDIHTDVVSVGSVVQLKDLDSGDELEFQMVGTSEADPGIGKISDESPVGAALKEQKKGAVIEVKVPDGLMKFKVLKITKEASTTAKRGRK
ncbi:MAG: hypothetical protein FJX76_08480 [Armatimonadetes bacterium]|nr:hypothetical protein [Armatimonadota bacterium]